LKIKVFQARSRLDVIPANRRGQAWLESVLVTLGAVALSAFARPEDPFFVAADFPWPVLGPVLVALRYGFFFGFISALLYSSLMGAAQEWGWWQTPDFPLTYSIGAIVLSMLIGEFRDHWSRTLERLHETNNYRQLRLDEFTRTYHLLKVSHDRLEQQLAGSGYSLREALRYVQRQIIREQRLTAQTAQSLLSILVEYGSLQRAGIFVVEDDQHLQTKALAQTGGLESVDADDVLLRRCITSRKLIAIRPEMLEQSDHFVSELLACVPLVDAQGRLWAVVAVAAMPFFAFQDKTLKLITVLAAHMADLLYLQSELPQAADPDRAEFILNLRRCVRDREQFGIPGALLIFTIERSDVGDLLAQQVRRMRRGLDIILEHTEQDRLYMILLLPLTDELGAAGYRQRLEDIVKQELGLSVAEMQVTLHRHYFSHPDALKTFLHEHLSDGQPLADLTSSLT
jgi:polysaccharide biosynthesis protein PelD